MFFRIYQSSTDTDTTVQAEDSRAAAQEFAATLGYSVQDFQDQTCVLGKGNRAHDVITVCELPSFQKQAVQKAATPKDLRYHHTPHFYVAWDEATWRWFVRCDTTGTHNHSSWYLEVDAQQDAESRNKLAILAHIFRDQTLAHK